MGQITRRDVVNKRLRLHQSQPHLRTEIHCTLPGFVNGERQPHGHHLHRHQPRCQHAGDQLQIKDFTTNNSNSKLNDNNRTLSTINSSFQSDNTAVSSLNAVNIGLDSDESFFDTDSLEDISLMINDKVAKEENLQQPIPDIELPDDYEPHEHNPNDNNSPPTGSQPHQRC